MSLEGPQKNHLTKYVEQYTLRQKREMLPVLAKYPAHSYCTLLTARWRNLTVGQGKETQRHAQHRDTHLGRQLNRKPSRKACGWSHCTKKFGIQAHEPPRDAHAYTIYVRMRTHFCART